MKVQFNEYNNYTHSTKHKFFDCSVYLLIISTYTLLPMLLGYYLMSESNSSFLSVIGIGMTLLGALLLIPGVSVFMESCKNTFLSEEVMQKFVAKQHKKIDHKRNELIIIIAERYVFENDLPHIQIEQYIKDKKWKVNLC